MLAEIRAWPGWRRPGIGAVGVFLATFLIYSATISPAIVNTDVAANSLAAWRLAHTGQPWMEGLDLHEDGKVMHYGEGRDGHMVTTRTPGQIWAAAPFYVGSTEKQEDLTYARSGLAAAFLTAGAVALMFSGLLRQTGRWRLALGGTAVFAFATPVWSVSANALWTHPVTLLGICGAVWALPRQRWWWAGIWFGVAMTGRLHVALIAAVVGLALAWYRRSPRIAFRIGIPTTISLGVLAAWSRYVFGSWDPRGAYANHAIESMVPSVSKAGGGFMSNLAGFLISPDRGVFVWTPLLLLLLPAVVRGWRSAPDWTRWLAVGGIVYGAAQVGLNVFHGGDAFFGYRLALEPLAAVAPLYVCCAGRAGSWARAVAPAVIGVQAGAFFLGAVVDWLFLPEAFVWSDNALWRGLIQFPGLVPFFIAVAVAAGVVAHRMTADTAPMKMASRDAEVVPSQRLS